MEILVAIESCAAILSFDRALTASSWFKVAVVGQIAKWLNVVQRRTLSCVAFKAEWSGVAIDFISLAGALDLRFANVDDLRNANILFIASEVSEAVIFFCALDALIYAEITSSSALVRNFINHEVWIWALVVAVAFNTYVVTASSCATVVIY